MDADCPHGDDPNLCPPCVKPRISVDDTSESLAEVVAMFAGDCPEGDRIEVGDRIVHGPRGWQHLDC